MRTDNKHDAIRNFANAPQDYSFSQTFRLKCFNAFVINVPSMGPTKGFNIYWTSQSIFDAARITKKKIM